MSIKRILALLLSILILFSLFSQEISVNAVSTRGDINGDGRVSSLDALMALQSSTGLITLTEAQKQLADINKNGEVSVIDALMILQYSVGLIQWPPATKLYGIDFGPYVKDGQNPNYNYQVSATQMHELIDKIAPYTEWVRSFSASGDHANFGALAKQHGLKVAVGCWLGRESSEVGLTANQTQIAGLIAQGQSGNADLLIVGSETLLRQDMSDAQIIAYINQVKAAVPGIPVATADVYGKLIDHPDVVEVCDVLLPNFYPYWEGVSITNAPSFMFQKYNLLQETYPGKQIIISEAGWPSEGNNVGSAVPSLENAALFLKNFVSFAESLDIPYFYFEGYDEPWKYTTTNPQEAHWGIWNSDGTIKTGMQATFDGERVADNWSGNELIGGPGTPTCVYTYVPPYGEMVNTRIQGQVMHVRPAEYKVVTYIKVINNWWTKPYYDTPTVSINIDGSWSCETYTGGSDYNANQINSYVIPITYDPPLLGNDPSVPDEVMENAVAFATVTRSP